jgi:hypothetical protein
MQTWSAPGIDARRKRPGLAAWGLGAWGLAAALAAQTGLASAQPRAVRADPPYPARQTLTAVADWVGRNTNMSLGAVIGVGDGAVFALEPATGATPPIVRVRIRQEATQADTAQRLGGRSAVMTIDIDCARSRVFQRGLVLYKGANRMGPVQNLGAGAGWQAVPPGTFMDNAVAAICDPSYHPLFPAGQVSLSLGGAPPARPAAPAKPVTPTVAAAKPAPRPAAPAPAQQAAADQTAIGLRPRLAATPVTAAPPAPVRTAAARVDLGIYDSMPAALDAWRGAAGLPEAAGGRQRIEIVSSSGQTRFRSLVDGFSTSAQAAAFCEAARKTGRTCSAS